VPSPFFELTLVQESTRTYTFDMYEADCSTQHVAAATDQVRFKLWQTNGAAPDLDLSNVANANGSRAYISDAGQAGISPAVATVKSAQDDTLTLTAGLYNAELGFINDSATSPADAYTVVARGTVRVIGSATWERGLA
jgi:hypothetical protein